MNNDANSANINTEASAHFGIRARMLAGFTAIIGIFLISTVMTLYFVNSAQNDSHDFLTTTLPLNLDVVDLQSDIFVLDVNLQEVVFFHDLSARKIIDQQLVDINERVAKISSNVSRYHDEALTKSWEKLSGLLNNYLLKISGLFKLVDNNAGHLVEYYKSEIVPSIKDLNVGFNASKDLEKINPGILDVLRSVLSFDMNDISKQITFINVTLIVCLAIACISSYLIAILTSRSILIPINTAIKVAIRIASGERNIEINTSRRDEAGQMLKSLAVMQNAIKAGEVRIQQNATDIMQACSSMVSTLDEVRHAVDAQSSGASEQASSINQITASITEIEKSASQTMSKAKDLGGVAEKTRQNGQLGLDSIVTSVMGMKSVRDRVEVIAQTILDLSRQTQQVGEITAVVNNLAQQSKMLALNASIEAAKAGDAGKGFAVVASEVKNLAEQSEQSTSQVQKILEDIKIATEKAVMVTEEGTKGVDNGLQMIERTGEIIRDLNDVIREAAVASQQIEAAVRQESAGIEQITAGMNEINSVTSSFVESVGQTTEAMTNLANVTSKLKSSVETYNS